MRRRELLRALAAGAGLRGLERLGLAELIELGERLHGRARLPRETTEFALGPHERRTVAVAAERMIPTTDTPGANDADVAEFVDRMLADWYDAADRDRVLAGLAELDSRSGAIGGRDFNSLAERDQLALLSALDGEAAALRRSREAATSRRDSTTTGHNAPEHWFSTFKFLVVWGYCTSEAATRQTFGEWPPPGRYDGCAPYAPGRGGGEA